MPLAGSIVVVVAACTAAAADRTALGTLAVVAAVGSQVVARKRIADLQALVNLKRICPGNVGVQVHCAGETGCSRVHTLGLRRCLGHRERALSYFEINSW